MSTPMTADDLGALLPALEAFYGRFHGFFRRPESRRMGGKYLLGLTLPIERKNGENIAEQVEATPRKLQEFLSDSPWDDAGCISELQRFVGEQFGAPNGVLVLDDTGFVKKGTHSAGVGRQYSGTLGRTDNCQVGVFMGYASAHGHTLVDRRLYLMRQWFEDPAKRSTPKAALPAALEFQTKPALAMEMLRACTEAGALPYQWVTADAAYGDIHDLRLQVAALGRWYCSEVSRSSEVWRQPPRWQVPASSGRGPAALPPAAPPGRRSGGAGGRDRARAACRALDPAPGRRGREGTAEYEFVRMRVVQKLHHEPGHEGWLMARRPVGADSDAEVKFYLSNAPEAVALPEMAWAGCLRWTIEEDFELAKGEVGLDHYEVTKYRGWYHHIALCLLALAFLKSVQLEWGKKWGAGIGPRGAPAA